jgi:hypothetical protein
MPSYQVSEDTKKALDDFGRKDAEFQQAWATFEQQFEKELVRLELLRENRNASLELATKALREEADRPECDEKVIKYGPFSAMKKESKGFHPEMMLARIEERDLYDAALAVGAVEEKITIKYNEMKQFLNDKKIYEDFEDCEDAQKLTTAITGPKSIGPFGAEMKKKK